jgi:prophage regulatory protein
MVHPDDEDIRMLRIEVVIELIPVSKVSIYRMIKAGDFPAPIKAGGVSLWSNEDVRAWKNAKLGKVSKKARPRRDISDLV